MLRGTYLTDYYRALTPRAVDEIRDQSDSYILGVDTEEYADFLMDKYSLSPLVIDEEHVRMEQIRRKRRVRDAFDDEEVTREFEMARIELPVSPLENAELTLDLIPSTYTLSPPRYEYTRGVVALEVPASEGEIESVLANFRLWFDNRNRDIERENEQLRVQLRSQIEGRKQQVAQSAEHFQQLVGKVNIPLKRKPDAETKFVNVSEQKEIRALKARPTAKRVEELTLDRETVLSVIDIIDRLGREFERSPGVYAGLEEEQLRDIIVNNLNTVFEGGATGETFQKLGKTDVRLVISAGEILIAECLYWNGGKAYGGKIDQLFRYLTWRESFGIVITFSRNQGFADVVEQARTAATSHVTHKGRLQRIGDSHFQSIHGHPDDSTKNVEMHHLLYNLYTSAAST